MYMVVKLYGPILRLIPSKFRNIKKNKPNLLAQLPLLLDVLIQIEIKWFEPNWSILYLCLILQREEFVPLGSFIERRGIVRGCPKKLNDWTKLISIEVTIYFM